MKRSKKVKNETTLHSLIRLVIFFLLTVLFAGLSVTSLVSNSQKAKDLYDSLLAVDKAGGDVEKALNDLRGFIYVHMNTTIGSETGIQPPIQLEGTYSRLVAAERERVRVANEALTRVAQAECERLNPTDFSGKNRVPCVSEYIEKNGTEIQPILGDLYKFDFVSPLWSPDLAGFSLLATFLCGLLFVVDLFLYFRTRRLVRESR